MGQLDILTPKGQQTLKDEIEAAAIWAKHYPTIEYRMTDKAKPLAWDAHMVKNGKVRAVVETKCRYDLTLRKFMQTFNGEWLVTWEKVMDCIAHANHLDVPFVGFLYLVDDKTLLWETIWKPEHNGILVPYRGAETETQATVNGGKAKRLNGFLDMKQARRLV